MRRFRGLAHQLPLLVVWLLLSVILWSWVFTLICDTKPENKLVLFVDAPVQDARGLSGLLEEKLHGAVRMVQTRPFSYAMMNGSALRQADLYIVPASHAAEYAAWFAPGQAVWQVYTARDGRGAAEKYIAYENEEDYTLYLGAQSVHLEDGLAKQAAELFLTVQ